MWAAMPTRMRWSSVKGTLYDSKDRVVTESISNEETRALLASIDVSKDEGVHITDLSMYFIMKYMAGVFGTSEFSRVYNNLSVVYRDVFWRQIRAALRESSGR
jgi:hypothetical protein